MTPRRKRDAGEAWRACKPDARHTAIEALRRQGLICWNLAHDVRESDAVQGCARRDVAACRIAIAVLRDAERGKGRRR